MAVVRRTSAAEQDLSDVVDYIAKDSVDAAVRWLGEVESLFSLLSVEPEIGELVVGREFSGVRRRTQGRYVIYYRPIENGVEIIRVVHGARDHRRVI